MMSFGDKDTHFFYKTNKDTSKMTIFAEKIGELP